ncbi:MAG: FliA/WhiG family RNA polymerase sigma factor [Planctomycetes bacterium]|nr:FliA/WhiG family RNA polymerase sigma factor [Planctomycetota bacterium]
MHRKRPSAAPRTRTRTVRAGHPPGPTQLSAPLPSKRKPSASDIARLAGPDSQDLWEGYLGARGRAGKDPAECERWRNALIEQHLPLVRFVAERLARTLPRSVSIDDLASAGVFGLMDAIRGFDPQRSVRFKTYATARVRGAILDSLRSDDWVPRLVRLRASKVERALSRLSSRFGREPTHVEIAEELGLEPGDVAEQLSQARPRIQHRLADHVRDASADSEHEAGLHDLKAHTPLEQLLGRDSLRSLRESLSHKERFILEQYYEVGHTMRAIGEMLSLTESRVCQIHTNILGRLRLQIERSRRGEET